MARTEFVTGKVEPDVKERLDQEAARLGVPRATMVHLIVAAYLDLPLSQRLSPRKKSA